MEKHNMIKAIKELVDRKAVEEAAVQAYLDKIERDKPTLKSVDAKLDKIIELLEEIDFNTNKVEGRIRYYKDGKGRTIK